VHLRDAGGDGGVYADGEASATITALSCARCAAPTLAYACSARISSSDVRAEEGTERTEVKIGCVP